MSDRTPLYIVGLLVSLVVGGLMLREPLLEPYHALGRQIEKDRERKHDLTQELARRKQAQGEVGEVTARFGEPLTPDERRARATSFYRQVENLVTSSGLQVVSLQPKPDELTPAGLVRFPVMISVTGKMDGVVALLSQIRNTPAVLGVERLTVRRRDESDLPIALQAQLVAYGVADQATRDKLVHDKDKKGKKG